ncbi:hypothetical protein ACTUVN_003475 [Pseudomonas caspiana]
MPYEWIFKIISIDEELIITYGATRIAYEWTLALSFSLTSIIAWLSTGAVHSLMKPTDPKYGTTIKKKLRLLLTWYVFFLINVAVLFLLCLGLPEVWLHELIMGDRHVPCDNPEWNEIYGSLVLALSLPVSGVVVAFTPALAMKVSRELKRWPRSTGDHC